MRIEPAPRVDPQPLGVPRLLDRAAALSWRLILVGVVVVAAFLILARLQVILVSTAVALLAASGLSPAMQRLTARGAPRTLAALTLLGAVAGLVVLAGWVLVPEARDEIEALDLGAGDLTEEVRSWLVQGPLGLTETQVDRLFDRAETRARQAGPRVLLGAWNGALVAFEIAAGVLLSIVLAFFFLRDGDRMWKWVCSLFPPHRRERWNQRGHDVRSVLAGYIRGTAIVSAIDAAGIGLGLYLLGVPLVVPLALLTFVGGFVPIVGATVAGLVAVLVALAANGLPTALAVLGVVIGVQQLEGTVLQPTIVGRSVNLHPVGILLAVGTGAVLWGIVGALLAVPFTAALATVLGDVRAESSAHAASGREG